MAKPPFEHEHEHIKLLLRDGGTPMDRVQRYNNIRELSTTRDRDSMVHERKSKIWDTFRQTSTSSGFKIIYFSLRAVCCPFPKMHAPEPDTIDGSSVPMIREDHDLLAP
jgi:hypothetical protein